MIVAPNLGGSISQPCLACLALPCPALPCPALPCLCPALPCLCLALPVPCPALPCPALSSPARFAIWNAVRSPTRFLHRNCNLETFAGSANPSPLPLPFGSPIPPSPALPYLRPALCPALPFSHSPVLPCLVLPCFAFAFAPALLALPCSATQNWRGALRI